MHTQRSKWFTKRSMAFAVGMTLTAIGMLMFLGLAVTLQGQTAAPDLLPASTKWKIISGVALVTAGFIVMTLGSQSLAIEIRTGESLEHSDPWREFVKDGSHQTATSNGFTNSSEIGNISTAQRDCDDMLATMCCRLCRVENDADAKYCDQCGEQLVFTA